MYPTPDMKVAARSARSADSADSAASAAASAAYSALSADSAAYSAYSARSALSADSAALSADSAASAAASAVPFWRAIQSDCETLTKPHGNAVPTGQPLWPADARAQTQTGWAVLRNELNPSNPDTAQWSFWLDWYQRALDGTEDRWDLLQRIALSDLDPNPDGTPHDPEDFDPFWEGPDAEVNARITAIVERFALAKTHNAEVLSINPESGRLRVDPVTDLAPVHMQEAVEEIEALVARLDGFGDTPKNPLPLRTELTLLSAARDRIHAPRQLHRLCRSVLRRIRAKIRIGDCPEPEKDPDMADIVGTLLDVTTTLIERDPEVKEAATLADQSPTLPPDGEAASALATAASETAPLSEGDLANELPVDAETLTNPLAPEADRREAGFQIASRIIRVWRIVTDRKLWEDVENRTKPVAGAIKNISIIGGAVTAPAWLPAAMKYILQLFS